VINSQENDQMRIATITGLSITVLALAPLLATACSSGGASCGGTTTAQVKASLKCPNDPVNQEGVDQCNRIIAAPNCGASGAAMRSCIVANTQCKGDSTDWTVVDKACATQQASWEACCKDHPADCK
jgi:hypothetical protein